MKNKIFFLGSLLFIIACSNPVEKLEIGEPFPQSEAIVGDWDLTLVRHIDDLDLSKPYTDLTAMFSSGTLSITGSSFTYSQGSGPNFLETSGTWAFDDPDYPALFILNDNMQLRLGAPVRATDNTLTLVLERTCDSKVISSYEYQFTRN